MKAKLKLVMEYAKPHKLLFIVIFVAIIISAFSGALYPYVFGKLVDEVFYKKNLNVFIQIASLYGLIFLFDQLIHFLINMIWAQLMTRFIFDIRKALFDKVLSYKGNSLSSLHTGDVIYKINNDTEQIMNFIHNNVFFGFSRILNLIFALYIIYTINWSLSLIVIVLVPITVYMSRWFAKRVRSYYKQMSEQTGLLSSWLFEMIKGMQDIRLLSATKNMLSDYVGKTIKIIRLQIKVNKVEVTSDRINSGISLIGQLVLYAVSAVLINNGQLSIGGFTACISYFGTCVSVFNNLNNKANSIAGNMVSFDRIIKLLDEPSEAYNEDTSGFEIADGCISFEHIVFGYSEDKPVLQDVSFNIESGKQISLVGYSGAGKSTIANLIYKLYEIQSGTILIDGVDIRQFNLHKLRNQIGIVHQDVFIFDETIRYNLIFSNDSSRDQEVWDALAKSHLADFIKTLPDGLNTFIGNGKRMLSGGQKQRLAVARIFIKNPKILIFDEATSSLDNEAEQVIKDSWEQLSTGRTMIIIAHRLSTIIHSDKVLVLNNGEIVGYNRHETLLKECDIYNQLFNKQYSLLEEVASV